MGTLIPNLGLFKGLPQKIRAFFGLPGVGREKGEQFPLDAVRHTRHEQDSKRGYNSDRSTQDQIVFSFHFFGPCLARLQFKYPAIAGFDACPGGLDSGRWRRWHVGILGK